MVDCTGLENQRGGNLSVSSNLTPSARYYFFVQWKVRKSGIDYEKLFLAIP